MGTRAQAAGSDTRGLLASMRGAPGVLGKAAGSLSELKASLAGVAGPAAVGIAVLAVAKATTDAIVGLGRYGVAQADARRSELLRLEGLTKLRYYMFGFSGGMAQAAGSASFLQEQIDRVSGSVALGRAQVAGYAEQLYKMGLRGANLQQALEGVSITAATQGDAQAQAFAGWAAGAAMTGQSVRRLADDVRARLGGIAKAQLLSLSVQTEKLHESFAMLFSGLKLDRLLNGVAEVTSLFSQATYTGRALKAMITGLMQPLIDGVAQVGPIVKRFFQGIVIGALLATIGILKIRNMWNQAFGGTTLHGLDMAKVALIAGAGAAYLLAGALAPLAYTFLTIGTAVKAVSIALEGWRLAGVAAYNTWQELGWKGLGEAIVRGIVDGIEGGATWVISAVERLGAATWKAFKEKLQIHSPSRLFRVGGMQVGAGVALGLQDAHPRVETAATRLLGTPAEVANDVPARTAGGTGGFGRSSVTIHAPVDLHVHADGSASEDIAAAARRAIEEAFEGIAVHIGARNAEPEAA